MRPDKRYRPSCEILEDRLAPARTPVLVVPGILGSGPTSQFTLEQFLSQRGFLPTNLQFFDNTYEPTMDALEAAGYVEGKDLFAAVYDWRMPNAPNDTAYDGTIGNLTAAGLTDGVYEYGVDYLGYWLDQAAQAWDKSNPGVALTEVDIVAHSMGNVVTRAYIQSTAYRGAYTDAQGNARQLPGVRNYVSVSAPSLGASTPWNLANDNAITQGEYELLASFLHPVFEDVANGSLTVTGPTPITQESITSVFTGGPDGELFLSQYVGSLRDLIATYNFLDPGTGTRISVNNQDIRNDLVLDLNGGPDPNGFINRVREAVIIYGTNVNTYTFTDREVGVGGQIFSVETGNAQPTVAGQVWFEDILVNSVNNSPAGDGTVPIISLEGNFVGDARFEVRPFTKGVNTQGDVGHSTILTNTDVLNLIVATVTPETPTPPPPSPPAPAAPVIGTILVLDQIQVNPVRRRAPVRELVLVLDGLLGVLPGAFRVVRLGRNGGPVRFRTTTRPAGGKTAVVLRFVSPLSNGRYLLLVRGQLLRNVLANALGGDLFFDFASPRR
jgi:hypothetical protein